jgi:hypothetical protein
MRQNRYKNVTPELPPSARKNGSDNDSDDRLARDGPHHGFMEIA